MQLEAYNAKDIESFMQWWSEDCQYYAFPNTLLASGTAAIRERHVERFQEPDLHGTLLHRMTVGNVVIDMNRPQNLCRRHRRDRRNLHLRDREREDCQR